jgi:DNA (cytosine-5)-methyltransferase 1
MIMEKEPIFLVVDLFCGAGGTTTGFAMAKDGIAKVIACVNHDPKAIESHWKNHPEVKHFEEDIRTLDLTELIEVVRFQRSLYPSAKVILWASLECTNFSKAKGGQPRDADSRTLADHLHRYVVALSPDYVKIENVVEFMSWGPLDDKGKPVSRKNGQDWMRWCSEMCAHGYVNEWKELNSADFGAYTSRNRLFGVFARPENPICWPEPTHSKKPGAGMFEILKKWMAVKEVLDFSDEGMSIFTRKKPLSEKTLERIYAGLIKYVAKGDKAFISKYFSGRPKGKVNSVNEPGPTNTTFGGNSLVQTKSFADQSVNQPCGSVTTIDHHALVQPISLLKYNSTDKNGKHTPPSINEPSPVISTQVRLGLVQGEFLTHYYGNGFSTSINEPCPTVTTKERSALVQSYIVNPSHGGHCTSSDAPCPVIVARQDKAPLYLVQVENGPVAIAVYDGDSECMIAIKEFMAAFNLVDIKMRMLRVHELLKIQGFPNQYVLCGNQSDQKKFIGNSVVPLVVKVWAEAMADKLKDNRKFKRA